MKHIDINPLVDAVKNIEAQEARRALKAYGGHCEFESSDPPYAEYATAREPKGRSVKAIRYGSDGKSIILEMWDPEFGGWDEIPASDLYPGQLLSVIDYM